jgi:hypothetical protein
MFTARAVGFLADSTLGAVRGARMKRGLQDFRTSPRVIEFHGSFGQSGQFHTTAAFGLAGVVIGPLAPGSMP